MADKRPRLPEWFRTRLPSGELQQKFNETKLTVEENMLNTVCQEAKCPNIHECWAAKDATFMVAGQECTRGCRFCAVGTIKRPPPLDLQEPTKLAEAISKMGLRHAVITVVNRDDLPDSGASHYKECLIRVRESCPDVTLELLCSDLAGDHVALAYLLENLELEVFAHNVECVPRLDKIVRDSRASFKQSIDLLMEAKRIRPDILTKSSIMVGLGETDDEITEALIMLREANVDLVTIGQYLAPSSKHLPIDRFPNPTQFDDWAAQIEKLGFLGWACGPLVRSSYRAGDLLIRASARLRTDGE
ncbi:MAG: lipoyl synthase [Candidatus Poseidoniaceae archaeon]|jgi:lipoic acid synthetase|nr:lipoyl synthase [Candidatus Poseidoniaceae archaeon]